MTTAPIFYCIMAAWIYSNQEVFVNDVVPNATLNLFPNSNHSFRLFFQ